LIFNFKFFIKKKIKFKHIIIIFAAAKPNPKALLIKSPSRPKTNEKYLHHTQKLHVVANNKLIIDIILDLPIFSHAPIRA
jgi:hypothetical protein